jgi:hypothetical protein
MMDAFQNGLCFTNKNEYRLYSAHTSRYTIEQSYNVDADVLLQVIVGIETQLVLQTIHCDPNRYENDKIFC